jgi:hypothetical protein
MVSLYSLYSFQNFNDHDSFWREELCEAHSNMLLTLSNPRNIQNHNYGIMSLFIKTHWMAGRQAGRQASKALGQANKGKQDKASQGSSRLPLSQS